MYKKAEEEPRWGRGHLIQKVPKWSSRPGEMEEAETMGKSGELALSGGGRDPKRKGCYGAAAMTQMAASRSDSLERC